MKGTILKWANIVFSYLYISIFFVNWIYEITVSDFSLRLITSRVALAGLVAFLFLLELRTKEVE